MQTTTQKTACKQYCLAVSVTQGNIDFELLDN
jgi:hypothetical protein